MSSSASKSAPQKFKTDLSVSVTPTTAKSPVFSPLATPGAEKKRSLDQAWKNAQAEFKRRTKRDLVSLENGRGIKKEGLLDQWKARYEREDSKDQLKKRKMLDVLQTVLDGIEVVGAFAASAASIVFGPADMCFNAVSFLIDAPRQITKVYDCLKELFEEVRDYLIRFKVYQRIDRKEGLSEELIDSSNDLLITFVEICALAFELLEGHTFVVALKAVFLKSDSDVSGKLESFRQVTLRQSMLTGAITLEHVISSEESMKKILETADETRNLIRIMASDSNDEKTRRVNQERLNRIEKELFARGEPRPQDLPTLNNPTDDFLPGTLTPLKEAVAYQEWDRPPHSERTILYINGQKGTGRTTLLKALKQEIEFVRQRSERADPSTYVAYHSFYQTIRRSTQEKYRPVPLALKNMALQVAEQSTVYATTLERRLRPQKATKVPTDPNDLWHTLGMCDFAAPPGSKLYLMFDNFESLRKEDVKLLLDILMSDKKGGADTVKLRLLLAGDQDCFDSFDRKIPCLDWVICTQPLLEVFIEKELARLQVLEDDDLQTIKFRNTIRSELLESVNGNFLILRLKLEQICEASENDAPEDELMQILKTEIKLDASVKAQKTIDEVSADLSARHVTQLNALLIWIIYGFAVFSTSELEAVLRLNDSKSSLEPLAKKMKQRFQRLVSENEFGYFIDPDIQEALEREDIDKVDAIENSLPLINMTISIRNAGEESIRRFIWDLNKQMTLGMFDFEEARKGNIKRQIYVNKLNAHYTIVRLCFKLANDEPPAGTHALVGYALRFLPYHLKELQELSEKVPRDVRKMIGQGLVGFLSDPYGLQNYWESAKDLHECWIGCSESIRFWLTDQDTLDQLQPREKRWVEQAVRQEAGPIGFYLTITLKIGQWWLCDRKGQVSVLFNWIDKFLEANEITVSGELKEEIAPEKTTNSDNGGGPQVSVNVEGSETTPISLSLKERVERAAKWVTQNLAKENIVSESRISDLQALILERLGFTCLMPFLDDPEESDLSASIQYLEKADSLIANQWTVAWGLASAQRRTNNMDEALRYLHIALSPLRLQRNEREFSPTDTLKCIDLLQMLDRFAEALSELGQKVEDTAIFKEAFGFDHDLDQFKWKMLRWYLVMDNVDAAEGPIQQWIQQTKEDETKKLSKSFRECLQEDFNAQWIEQLLCVSQGNLRNTIIEVLEEAISDTEGISTRGERSVLLYLHGVMVARNKDLYERHTAVDLWEDSLRTGFLSDVQAWEFWRAWVNSAQYATMHEFDALRVRVVKDESISFEEKDTMRKDLARYIQNRATITAIHSKIQDISRPDTYLAAFCALIGQPHQARVTLAEGFYRAMDILYDEDPDNDREGIEALSRILLYCGDIVGALSCWSLLDRPTEPDKALTDGGTPSPTVKKESRSYYCDDCGKDLFTSNPEGVWWCKYCPNQDLCTQCYKRFKDGKQTLYYCNVDHEFVRMYHTEYSDEEIAPGKVRVGWKYVPDDTVLGGFKREGGSIIDLETWLDQLRLEWGMVDKPAAFRAQK